ncbi:MAG: aldo/keto reductase [Candidatus Heimdallarchaeota archaeon]|nr:aldo/keto reductase [Candidatus Heimdallarchaeota archaeon]MCK4877287.1 aldo/keto reductase [Candidatus Heimdallarchaeota archaeon]
MKKIRFGKSDLEVSEIGLGTLTFGHPTKGILDFNEIKKLLNYALDNGINFLDTAEEYAGGLSEKYIGEIIKERGDREDVIIETKASPPHCGYKELKKACNRSLKRLQTDYIDIYLLHWPWCYYPLDETAKALDELIEEGKIRYAGVSNYHNPLVEELMSYLKNGDVITNQLSYCLTGRSIEKEILPFSRKMGIQITAWGPLDSGFLTGKYNENSEFEKNDFRNKMPLFQTKENFVQTKPLFNLMETLAEKYEANLAQIALNWIIKKDRIIPIPGAKSSKQVESNINATKFSLTNKEINELSDLTQNMDLWRF